MSAHVKRLVAIVLTSELCVAFITSRQSLGRCVHGKLKAESNSELAQSERNNDGPHWLILQTAGNLTRVGTGRWVPTLYKVFSRWPTKQSGAVPPDSVHLLPGLFYSFRTNFKKCYSFMYESFHLIFTSHSKATTTKIVVTGVFISMTEA